MQIVQKEIDSTNNRSITYGYTLKENDYNLKIEFTVTKDRTISFHFPAFQMETPSYLGFNLLIAKELAIDWNMVNTIHIPRENNLKDTDRKKLLYAIKAACSDLRNHLK